MFAVIGVAGIIGIQQWAHREEAKQRAAAALKSALKAASRTARLSASSDRRSASSDSSRGSFQHASRGSTLRDGAFVCFKDRTGQVAVIQPYGNGGSWQLTVTCAAGGCCLLPEGKNMPAAVAAGRVLGCPIGAKHLAQAGTAAAAIPVSPAVAAVAPEAPCKTPSTLNQLPADSPSITASPMN